jgi:Phytanoyl-CoA dioxygenase (PhyH)
MMHPNLYKKDFERTGFIIVSEVINSDAILSLIAALEQVDETVGLRQRAEAAYAIRNLLAVPAVKTLAESAPIRVLVENILGPVALAVRGLLFDKTPGANWKVTWHQDLTIAVKERREGPGYGPWSVKAGVQHVQPPASVLERMLTLRLNLDDCDESNGPLQVLPGSHRAGKLNATEIQDWRKRVSTVDCVGKRGSVLMMRPLLLHASSTAQKPGHRRVIHLEFASGELGGGLRWDTAG